MIYLDKEHALSLAQAASLFPQFRPGRPTCPATLTRWILAGVKAGEQRVFLRAARLGGRWIVSREAIAEFIEAQNPGRDANPSAPTLKPSRRHAVAERVDGLGM